MYLHLEDFLEWTWKQDPEHDLNVAPSEQSLNLIMRWLWVNTQESNDVKDLRLIGSPKLNRMAGMVTQNRSAMRSLKVCHICGMFGRKKTVWDLETMQVLVRVCSLVSASSQNNSRQGQPLDFQHVCIESFFRDAIQVLARASVDTQVLKVLWRFVDSIGPCLLDPEILRMESFWETTEINTVPVLGAFLKQIEDIQAGCDNYNPLCPRMVCSERILLFLSKYSEDNIFEDEPQALPALWEAIQDLLDDYFTCVHDSYGFDICDLAATGMLLLSNNHGRFPSSFPMPVDDLTLMVHYCLQLQHKVVLVPDVCLLRPTNAYMLVIELSRVLLLRLQHVNPRSEEEEEEGIQSIEMMEMCFDLLLDSQRDYMFKEDLIKTVISRLLAECPLQVQNDECVAEQRTATVPSMVYGAVMDILGVVSKASYS
ncbi:hypothetical protein BGZ83_008226 [Gryganskiella cystojenkinii]|nr:hypothetical protein BGZ83_008226 [Gryganskiella cystojenkinii]